MRALVTGAGGFVGANLARRLAAAGHAVAACVRSERNAWRLTDPVPPSVQLVEVDLARPGASGDAVRRFAPDAVFHLAAHGAYSWQNDLAAMVAVNLQATAELLDAARDIGATVVNAGSSSEYGPKDHAPDERARLEPASEYAVTKAAATHLCRLAAARHGQRAVTLRLYSVYGPWEEPNRLMPTLVDRALDGRLPPLADPTTARDFVYVDDACAAFERAASVDLDDPGAVFNIGSGTQTTLADLAALARELFALDAEPRWGTMASRPWDSVVWVADPRAATDALGWSAVTPLADGLRAMADWMIASPQHRARYREALRA